MFGVCEMISILGEVPATPEIAISGRTIRGLAPYVMAWLADPCMTCTEVILVADWIVVGL